MRMLLLSLAALAATMGLAVVPAQAGVTKHCRYEAKNPWSGHIVASGSIMSSWITVACNKAARQCNRELNRKRRNGVVAGDCHRV